MAASGRDFTGHSVSFPLRESRKASNAFYHRLALANNNRRAHGLNID
jgi:hypothetical protein